MFEEDRDAECSSALSTWKIESDQSPIKLSNRL